MTESSELELENIVTELESVSTNWISLHEGRKPTKDDVEGVQRWRELYLRRRELERTLAGEPKPGGCNFFIERRRRFCSNFCSENNDQLLCWMHQPQKNQVVCEELAETGTIEIDLSGKKKKNLSRRMKKMTNPMAIQHCKPKPPPEWNQIFEDPSLPLFLDIGCAKGKFIHELSKSKEFEENFGKMNFIGVEIFDSLVLQANKLRARGNCSYISANINTSYASLEFPALKLCKVSIQFPDPWHGTKKNRRVLNSELAEWLSEILPPGGQVYICSDVLSLAQEMKQLLLSSSFDLASQHYSSIPVDPPDNRGQEWLRTRPWGVPTERDLVCEREWRPVYRALLTRRQRTDD